MNNIVVSGIVSLIVSLIMNYINRNGNFSYDKLPALIAQKNTKCERIHLGKYEDGVFFYKIEIDKNMKDTMAIEAIDKPINMDSIANEGIILKFQDIKTNSMMLKIFSMGDMTLNLSNAENVDVNINADNRIVIFIEKYKLPIEIKGEIMGKQFIYSVRNESSSNKAKVKR